jgi:hypothetical protein
VAEAQAAFLEAEAWQGKAYQERARALQAHVTLGEREPGKVTAPNKASVLREQHPPGLGTTRQWMPR